MLPDKLPKEPLDNWIPKSTEVVDNEEQLQCIRNNSQIRERVQQTIKDVNCVISFASDAASTIKLEQIARGSESENQEWSDLCTGTFKSLLCDIITRKRVVTPEVLRRLKAEVENETLEVDVKFDEGSSEIQFSGFSDAVATFEKKFLVLKEEEERKRRKVDILGALRPYQISYFQQCGVADEVAKRFTNLSLMVDEQKVQLEGAEETLTDVKIFIYDSISQIEPRSVDLSQDLTQLITTEPTKTYVNDYLKQNGIRAIVEPPQPGKNGVTVYAIGREEIQKASSFLTTDFVSVHLELNDAARHAMLSPDWEVLVESLKQDYRFFHLHSSNDVLVVSGQKDVIEGIKRKIQIVFEKHVSVEYFFSMKTLNVQLIERFKKSDIETLENKLRASALGGKLEQVLTHEDASGFALKGNREEVEAAKMQLEELVRSAIAEKKEISRPGVVSLAENPEWTEFLGTVEQSHQVILKTTITNPYESSTSSSRKSGPQHGMVINDHSIIIVHGEITNIPDGGALINPTNAHLELSHGLGLQIVKLGKLSC